MSTLGKKAWWTWPENFHSPLVFYMEEELGKHVIDHGDKYLPSMEVHSPTLIQVEPWFTATSQTQVTVIGPHGARQWLLDMIRSVGSQNSCVYHHSGLLNFFMSPLDDVNVKYSADSSPVSSCRFRPDS
uniref:KH-like RNA-binding domain-containing protein n=1 Tax=Spermophilus dauricus TaxID=99837 RepID=A0A8C9QB54_SPEDA